MHIKREGWVVGVVAQFGHAIGALCAETPMSPMVHMIKPTYATGALSRWATLAACIYTIYHTFAACRVKITVGVTASSPMMSGLILVTSNTDH